MPYGASGDVRADLNSYLPSSHANYKGEAQIPGEAITYALAWASDEINAMLEPRYPDLIPWADGSVPSYIDKLANCLAAGFVVENKNPGPQPRKQDKYLSRMDHCRKTLEKLRDGEMDLPEIEKDNTGIYFTHSGRTPAADVDAIEDQEPDVDLLDDISDRRGS